MEGTVTRQSRKSRPVVPGKPHDISNDVLALRAEIQRLVDLRLGLNGHQEPRARELSDAEMYLRFRSRGR